MSMNPENLFKWQEKTQLQIIRKVGNSDFGGGGQ